MEEMKALKVAGGSTIVENTTAGIQRDLDFLRRVQTEVRVRCARVYYREGGFSLRPPQPTEVPEL